MNEGDAALDKQRSNQVEESSSSCTSSQRKPLADDEKKHIQEVFRDILRSNATITMQLVRETMKKEAKLIKLQEIEGMLKRVLDYLRNIQKNKPRQDLKELPVVQKSKQVETWLTSQAGPFSIETSTLQTKKSGQTKILTKLSTFSPKRLVHQKKTAIKRQTETIIPTGAGGNTGEKRVPTRYS